MHNRKFIFLLGLALCFSSVAEQIQFNVTYTDGDGTGFYDPTYGTVRRTAFQYACNIWSSYLVAAYAGETIHVSASFTNMGGSSTSATLGSAGPESFSALNFGVGSTGYLWANAANANHWAGSDIGSGVEISASFNSDVDNSTVLGSTDFYYGLDGNCGTDIDFVSVLMHEIGHGLGFTSLIDPNTGAYYVLHEAIPNTPSIYDYFLGLGASETDPRLWAMTDEERLAAITSDNIYWMGDAAIAQNGDFPPKIYAPEIWEQGSSISHEDETTFPNGLMSPYYSGSLHTPDAITLGMLEDMGWTIPVPEPSTTVMIALIGGIAVWIKRRYYDCLD